MTLFVPENGYSVDTFMAQALNHLQDEGIDYNSHAGEEVLAKTLSLAGQLIEGRTALPGTEAIGDDTIYLLRILLCIPEPAKQE